MPKHLSSDQVIAYLEQKKAEKQREDEKLKRKQERENKKKREEAKMKKQLEREKKKAEGRGTTKQLRGQEDLEPSSSSDSDSPGERLNNSMNGYERPVCGLPENGVDPWIVCDTCNRWYLIACSSVESVDPDRDLDELDWKCSDCV